MNTKSRNHITSTAGLVLGLVTTPAAWGQPTSSVEVWGLCAYGQCDVPAPNSAFLEIAAGAVFSLGLKADGSIVAWGDNTNGQLNVPAPNTGFVAVAAGEYHGLGLKADGSIVAWGSNAFGETNVPAPNTGFVAVAGGTYRSMALKADGSIVAWGASCGGTCDQNSIPPPNTGFVAIATGWQGHSLALKADNSIVAWGRNQEGQCDVPAPNTDFVRIAVGQYHSLGLKADGSIRAWGLIGDAPAPNTGFVDVAAGSLHSLGLKADGSIVAWGYNANGECNVPAPNTGFTAVAGGGYHSLGLRAAPDADSDDDEILDGSDNCPLVANTEQEDIDGDGVGDACDNCPDTPNSNRADADGDGIGNACDNCPSDSANDADSDGLCADSDNCSQIANSDQADSDGDSVGDVCDICPNNPNSDQADADGDGLGDACDSCPLDANNDTDSDGICGDVDNCPATPNPNQADADGDGIGDPCDACLEKPVVSQYRFEEGSPDTPASGRGSIVDSVDGSADGRPSGGPLYRGDVGASNAVACECAGNTLSLDLVPGQSVTINSPFIFHDSYGDATLEFFVKPRQQGHVGLLWTRPDNTDRNRYNIAINPNGGFGFDYRTPSGKLHLIPANASIFYIPIGTWTHIAVVRDTHGSAPAHDYHFYVNGVYTTTQTDPDPDLPDAGQLWQISGRSGFHYSGLIDEIRFSARTLTPGEFLINVGRCTPDFDLDGDVDEHDVRWFADCAAGPTIPLSDDCRNADQDGDGDGDQADFGILQRCYSGQAIPAHASCAR